MHTQSQHLGGIDEQEISASVQILRTHGYRKGVEVGVAAGDWSDFMLAHAGIDKLVQIDPGDLLQTLATMTNGITQSGAST